MSYRQRKDEVCEKGTLIRGKIPKKYQKDKFGNEMYYASYEKDSKKGWNIDDPNPVSKGSTYHIDNPHPMNSCPNKSKENKY